MRTTRRVSRRQAEALTESPDLDASAIQEREARWSERDEAIQLTEDVDADLLAELSPRFDYRTATAPPPVLTPWMRMDPAERDRIRARRRLRVAAPAEVDRTAVEGREAA